MKNRVIDRIDQDNEFYKYFYNLLLNMLAFVLNLDIF